MQTFFANFILPARLAREHLIFEQPQVVTITPPVGRREWIRMMPGAMGGDGAADKTGLGPGCVHHRRSAKIRTFAISTRWHDFLLEVAPHRGAVHKMSTEPAPPAGVSRVAKPDGPDPPKAPILTRIIDEIKAFIGMTIYLW